eukprot:1161432-Pelagomonas_calceolata.AAC.7
MEFVHACTQQNPATTLTADRMHIHGAIACQMLRVLAGGRCSPSTRHTVQRHDAQTESIPLGIGVGL